MSQRPRGQRRQLLKFPVLDAGEAEAGGPSVRLVGEDRGATKAAGVTAGRTSPAGITVRGAEGKDTAGQAWD